MQIVCASFTTWNGFQGLQDNAQFPVDQQVGAFMPQPLPCSPDEPQLQHSEARTRPNVYGPPVHPCSAGVVRSLAGMPPLPRPHPISPC